MIIGQKNLATEDPPPVLQELATSIYTTKSPRNYTVKPQWFDAASFAFTPALSAATPTDHKSQ